MDSREDEGYAYPDPATRRRAIIIGAISVLAGGLVLVGIVRPWLDHYLRGLEELAQHDLAGAQRRLLTVMALAFALNGSLAIGAGAWIFYVGWRIARAERWPYPGKKIYVPVKILEGNSARRRGRAYMVMGLILVLLVPVLGLELYRRTNALLDAPRPSRRLQ